MSRTFEQMNTAFRDRQLNEYLDREVKDDLICAKCGEVVSYLYNDWEDTIGKVCGACADLLINAEHERS